MKVGMIGGRTSTAGFKALGVTTFQVSEPGKAPEIFEEINLDEYGIIFVTEPIFKALDPRIKEIQARKLPVITVIPSVSASEGIAAEEIRALVERAVGTDIMFKETEHGTQ